MSRVLIVPDLHISDVYNGKHKDYFSNCVSCLEMLTQTIIDKQITHVYCLGDWVGIKEKNLRSRDALFYLISVLQKWNTLTNNNVYSIVGNHDIGSSITDFNFLVSLGYIKVVDTLDIGCLRLHGLGYGNEKRQVELDDSKYNIALMHNNLQVEGQTNWFRAGVGIELSSLENLYGITMVIAGHIHNPSVKWVSTSIKDKDISLFYPGNMTRPAKDPNIWNKSYGIIFSVDDNQVNLETVEYNLTPAEELFSQTYDDVAETEDDIYENVINIEELSAVLDELQQYNLCGEGDYKSQIKKLAGIDKEAADLALEYVEKVEEEIK